MSTISPTIATSSADCFYCPRASMQPTALSHTSASYRITMARTYWCSRFTLGHTSTIRVFTISLKERAFLSSHIQTGFPRKISTSARNFTGKYANKSGILTGCWPLTRTARATARARKLHECSILGQPRTASRRSAQGRAGGSVRRGASQLPCPGFRRRRRSCAPTSATGRDAAPGPKYNFSAHFGF